MSLTYVKNSVNTNITLIYILLHYPLQIGVLDKADPDKADSVDANSDEANPGEDYPGEDDPGEHEPGEHDPAGASNIKVYFI